MRPRNREVLKHALCVVLSAVFLAPVSAAEKGASDAVLGVWETADGKARVEVYRKKDADGQSRYEGKIVWLKEPNFEGEGPEHGDPLRDANNPDEARQHDRIMGLVVLKGFRYNARKRRWQDGTVYDPEVGKTYRGVIKLKASSKEHKMPMLSIRGYVGIRLLGRTTVWTRANAGAVKPESAE